MSDQDKRVTAGVEELAYSDLMTLNALVELLEEKGVVTKQEVLDRIKRLQERTWKPDRVLGVIGRETAPERCVLRGSGVH